MKDLEKMVRLAVRTEYGSRAAGVKACRLEGSAGGRGLEVGGGKWHSLAGAWAACGR